VCGCSLYVCVVGVLCVWCLLILFMCSVCMCVWGDCCGLRVCVGGYFGGKLCVCVCSALCLYLCVCRCTCG